MTSWRRSLRSPGRRPSWTSRRCPETLSTVDATGAPDARVLILKDVTNEGWAFASTASSRKGLQLEAHPVAALSLWWKPLMRAVRVAGPVVPASREESEADLARRSPAAQEAVGPGEWRLWRVRPTGVEHAMGEGDVLHLRHRETTTLSGGELARAGFARALAQTTELVLLDEPTAALDLRHQERVMQVSASLAREGHCVVVVLHDLNLAARHADRVAMFSGGALVADGPPAEVLTADRIEEVYGQPVQLLEHPVTGGPLVVPV